MDNPLLEVKESEEKGSRQEANRIDWQSFISKSGIRRRRRACPGRFGRKGPHESMVSQQVTLEEYLTAQWKFISAEPEIRAIGRYLIGNLSPSGYLTLRLEEAALDLGQSQAKIEKP